MKLLFVTLTILCLLPAIPATAQVLYDNGPINGTTDAWTINFGYVIGDSFTLLNNSTVGGFNFGVWETAGDVLTSVYWSITSFPAGGTLYGSGTASGKNLTDQFISLNQYGYDIDMITVTGLDLPLSAGPTYWLNLQNAVSTGGNPVYWDENSGTGCKGDNGMGGGCPSQAGDGIGSDPSESFDINGTSGGGTPEPGSFILLLSGILGVIGVLRRKLV
jgi:hypothetical protein